MTNKMNFLAFLSYMVMLMQSCRAQSKEKSTAQWKVYEFPDPVAQPKACGRQKESWICDPNEIISKSDADEIQEILESTFASTQCPCDQSQDCTEKNDGYVIMVAIMPRMYKIVNRSLKMEDLLFDAKIYSYYLSLYWNYTDCNQNILLLYSRDDDIIYTLTWRNARKVLADETVRQISVENRHYFDSRPSAESIGEGLKATVRAYSEVLVRERGVRTRAAKK